MPILVGRLECNGSESGLLECAHVTGSDEAVTQCDPSESSAIACLGKLVVEPYESDGTLIPLQRALHEWINSLQPDISPCMLGQCHY